MDRLYEALREEDLALRAAAAERDAARHQKILAAVGLVVMIAGDGPAPPQATRST